MRLRVHVDGYPLEICSRDPELIARWLLEIFASIEWTPATLVEVQAHPLYHRAPGTGQFAADWLTRSEQITRLFPVKSPREAAEALLAAVDHAGEAAEAERAHQLAESDPP
jgi:hypothetical protein